MLHRTPTRGGALSRTFVPAIQKAFRRTLASTELCCINKASFLGVSGSYAANDALNSDEFPIYMKLHGDFRYHSIKNLAPDLLEQDRELGKYLVNASNRFGLVVVGYRRLVNQSRS